VSALVVASTSGLGGKWPHWAGAQPLIVKMCKTIAAGTNTSRSSAMRLRVGRRGGSGYFSPARLKEVAHPVSGFAYRTIVFVEDFAVREHLPYVSAKVLARLSSRPELKAGAQGRSSRPSSSEPRQHLPLQHIIVGSSNRSGYSPTTTRQQKKHPQRRFQL
jgi:hypothetical protein